MDTWAIIYIASAFTLLLANALVIRWYGGRTPPKKEETAEM